METASPFLPLNSLPSRRVDRERSRGQKAFFCQFAAWAAFCVILGVFIAPWPSRAAETRVVAVSGQAPPRGTGTFAEGLGIPVLHNSGHAAFVSNLREDGFLSGGGLFRGDGTTGGLETIALRGDPLPDATGNFNTFPSVQINAAGQMTVRASLENSLGALWGIYRFDGPGEIVEIVRQNDPAPDGNGRFGDAQPFSLNDSGQVAFYTRLQDTSGRASDFQAIYRGGDGAVTELARQGSAVPGGEGTFTALTSQAFGFNGSGQALMWGRIDNQAFGPFRGNGTSTVLLAKKGDPAPDGDGALAGTFSVSPSFNDRGEAAFVEILLNTENGLTDNLAVFRADGDNLVEIARKGDLVPDGNGRFLQFQFGVPLNNRSEVLFISSISGAAGGSDQGVFIGDGANTRTVARSNDPAPGGGRFSNFVLVNGYFCALNNVGQAVFYAEIDLENGGPANDTFGLFFYDPVHGLFAVAREHDQLADIGPITLIQFAGSLVTLADEATGLNDLGQVAYRCHAGNEVAVVLWSFAPFAPPISLGWEHDHAARTITISWPASVSGVLEEAPELDDPDSWIAVDTEAALRESEYRVTVPLKGRRRYFRLNLD